jgi:hypothetical protein
MIVPGTHLPPRVDVVEILPDPCHANPAHSKCWNQCPAFEGCKRFHTECRAFRNYVNGRDYENMLMDRQVRILPIDYTNHERI